MNQQYSSTLLENAVNEFAKLPGIGRKTALRLVLHLLKQSEAEVDAFGNAFISLRREIVYSKVCHNISDTEVCHICSNPGRDHHTICVVENIKDVMTIENTQQRNKEAEAVRAKQIEINRAADSKPKPATTAATAPTQMDKARNRIQSELPADGAVKADTANKPSMAGVSRTATAPGPKRSMTSPSASKPVA